MLCKGGGMLILKGLLLGKLILQIITGLTAEFVLHLPNDLGE